MTASTSLAADSLDTRKSGKRRKFTEIKKSRRIFWNHACRVKSFFIQCCGGDSDDYELFPE